MGTGSGAQPFPQEYQDPGRDFRTGYPQGVRGRVAKRWDEQFAVERFLQHLILTTRCTGGERCIRRNLHRLRLMSFSQIVQWTICARVWSRDQWDNVWQELAKEFRTRSQRADRSPIQSAWVQKDYDKARVKSRDLQLSPCFKLPPRPALITVPPWGEYTGNGYPVIPPEEGNPDDQPDPPPPDDEPPEEDQPPPAESFIDGNPVPVPFTAPVIIDHGVLPPDIDIDCVYGGRETDPSMQADQLQIQVDPTPAFSNPSIYNIVLPSPVSEGDPVSVNQVLTEQVTTFRMMAVRFRFRFADPPENPYSAWTPVSYLELRPDGPLPPVPPSRISVNDDSFDADVAGPFNPGGAFVFRGIYDDPNGDGLDLLYVSIHDNPTYTSEIYYSGPISFGGSVEPGEIFEVTFPPATIPFLNDKTYYVRIRMTDVHAQLSPWQEDVKHILTAPTGVNPPGAPGTLYLDKSDAIRVVGLGDLYNRLFYDPEDIRGFHVSVAFADADPTDGAIGARLQLWDNALTGLIQEVSGAFDPPVPQGARIPDLIMFEEGLVDRTDYKIKVRVTDFGGLNSPDSTYTIRACPSYAPEVPTTFDLPIAPDGALQDVPGQWKLYRLSDLSLPTVVIVDSTNSTFASAFTTGATITKLIGPGNIVGGSVVIPPLGTQVAVPFTLEVTAIGDYTFQIVPNDRCLQNLFFSVTIT